MRCHLVKLFPLFAIPLLMALASGTAESQADDTIIGRLVVFVNGSCSYCRRFHSEVATFYDKTHIGRRLPLKEVDLDLPDEPYESLAKGVRFVPTFIVLDKQGQERGRFRGYRSDESFWSELEKTFHQLECAEKRAGQLPC